MKLSDLKNVLDESTRVALCDPFDEEIHSFDGTEEFPEMFANWEIGNLSVACGGLVLTVFDTNSNKSKKKAKENWNV